MKKIKKILFALAVLVLLPISVFAKDKINVYIFKGETCPYCANAVSFFNSLDEEYKSYFNLVEKEVWYDKENAALMQQVANYFNFEVEGVPFIVIGEKYFDGYTSSYDEEIKATIKSAYENEAKDVVAAVMNGEEKSSTTALTIIIILAVIAGVIFLIYMAKDNSVEEVEDEKKEEKIATEKKPTSTKKVTSKTTANKKDTSKPKAKATTAKKTTTSKKKTTAKK